VTPLLHGGAYVAAMSTDLRRNRGTLGEQIAADHLVRRGYRIVDRNYRTRHGELDIVAANARALIFCEVKTRVAGGRSGPATPLEAIGPGKQRRLRALAREWLAAGVDRPHRSEIRFDAIGVTITATGDLLALEHLEAAF
jgi:putative endonuclease